MKPLTEDKKNNIVAARARAHRRAAATIPSVKSTQTNRCIYLQYHFISLCDKDLSLRQIGEECGASRRIVARIKKTYSSASICSRNGRPRLISNRAAREIAHCIRFESHKTPKTAAQEVGVSASEWTIRRSLKKIGLKAKEKKRKPALSDKSIKLRKKFVDTYKEWTTEDWKRVIWPDETKINRFESDGKSCSNKKVVRSNLYYFLINYNSLTVLNKLILQTSQEKKLSSFGSILKQLFYFKENANINESDCTHYSYH
ncbi:Transposable element Tc1 transposase [Anthophora quadrimaculata]